MFMARHISQNATSPDVTLEMCGSGRETPPQAGQFASPSAIECPQLLQNKPRTPFVKEWQFKLTKIHGFIIF
jgi:hypothetical protein